MAGLQVLIRIEPEKRHEFLHVAELFHKTGKEKDSLISCHIYEDVVIRNRFICIYQSSEENNLTEHCNSKQFRAFLGAINVLGEQLESTRWDVHE
jgi:quinol monooxygenase YgiN